MKNVLFASTALAALAIGGAASAQGVTLFGDARLGLGYNINNDGSAQGDEDVRAISRVRFGVNMAGETDSGISFGATIRADNAAGGQGGKNGQTAGNVFVSGDWGTLTFGDTAGADENWVGDVPGNLSLTGLGDSNETIFISNGGGFGSDDTNDFFNNPTARPTVRYDFDIMGFGLSLSSNRDLTDIGVGAGYAGEFGGGSWNVGVGYYDYDEFDVVTEAGFGTGCASTDAAGDITLSNLTGDDCTVDGVEVAIPVAAVTTNVNSGTQWSGSLGGSFGSFDFGVVYTQLNGDGGADASEGLIGMSYGLDAWSVGGWYAQIIDASGGSDAFNNRDGDQSYGVSAAYDLGGGASVAGGVAQTFGSGADQEETVADFGIKMSF
jgi:outer membrane protein OmpU